MGKQEESSDPPRLLTEQMQARTKEAHSAADRAINLRLAGALTDRQRWAQCVATFYVVFERLEGLVSKHKDHPVLKAYPLEEACRSAGFVKDLAFYLGPTW